MDAIRYMNQAWRKVIAREALEREQRKRQHALGCPVEGKRVRGQA